MTRSSLFFAVLASTAFIAHLFTSPAQARDDLRVFTYASQVNDVDSVNSHWFETPEGTILIDAQRLLPEAERALRHLRATTEHPVVAIVVSHSHTDHFGGLPVWLSAFPDAQVITDATTLRSIEEDGRGFIAMRNARHGERFATQEALRKAVEGARVIAGGETMEVGGLMLAFSVLPASEAESTVVTSVVGKNAVFVGDLINVGVPAVPFEDLDAWLQQLDQFETDYGTADRLFIGHGPSPVTVAEIAEQRRYLKTLRGLVADALAGDSLVTAQEADQIVFSIEAAWPFLAGVAGNTRREVLAFSVDLVAEQLGGSVAESQN